MNDSHTEAVELVDGALDAREHVSKGGLSIATIVNKRLEDVIEEGPARMSSSDELDRGNGRGSGELLR